ncbi:MAG: hypothetical protein RIS29_440 [Bacteroidota bacterium]|jgi:hypothetical protein
MYVLVVYCINLKFVQCVVFKLFVMYLCSKDKCIDIITQLKTCTNTK